MIEVKITEDEILSSTLFRPVYAVARILKDKGVPAYVDDNGEDLKVASGLLEWRTDYSDRLYNFKWKE